MPSTVVVGKATPFASNEAPQAIALAVPLSLILIISFWKLVGVPDKLVVIEVMSVARAVIVTQSQLSVFMVGSAFDSIVIILGVTLLLVKVLVELIVGITVPSIERTPLLAVKVFAVACPNSIPFT